MIDSENNRSNNSDSPDSPFVHTECKHVFDRIENMFAPHKNKNTMLKIKASLIKLAKEGLLNE